ncbi:MULTISPECIES: 2-succinyl-6-hydroxy-2,4-cyclohexadiene-1-carboxylate synthase [unclassified Staphylococcus]|uniref:2-succinyl-6-hydroxy-2, 4-cyclohexadiene-1-carboxylate synthase n=1 Tax=unclassified Staphylococcus TaxID=91994 RepID=UPI0021D25199|nr:MULTISPECIES: 2-succinyl-6-hydroxy-2,4-cyclohexadiene-1-carboxylate synthase [unclassified Staphylococcus]UXR78920.1 2-succinyl-6-hydroxy-2,4-cyclohexadiene-1-carboxylate synthase [Staphylococcus sp. IVB6227]UXR83081.1 2-succinyl-6-hydroxy-2,4-cyclohexadiene-1-carboxylate synthase [Staphylococcus sp. IVB6214]
MLHYNWYPSQRQTKQTLVMLHGFISDQTTFGQHIEPLTEDINLLLVDLPGHGQDTSSTAVIWDFEWIITQLHELLSRYSEYDLYLHGYSMGARVALGYATEYGEMLSGLILESGSPGLRDEEARVERQQVDRARARVLELANLEVFVNDWERLPLFQSQQFLPSQVQQRIRQMRLSQQPERLAKALVDYGTGNMPNLWPRLADIPCPVQIIVGEWDEKFVSIAEAMKQHFVQANINIVPEVGHTVHVEEYEKFDTIILAFILAN